MALLPHQKIFIAFLNKLRFARDYTKRCLGRLVLLLAFLASGRKFSKWWHSRPEKPGTLKPDPPFLGTKTNSYSVSGGPAIVKQYVVTASSVPASASLPSLHERVEAPQATAAPMVDARVGTPPALANLPAEHPHDHDPLHPIGGGVLNRSSESLSAASIQSRASDRFSIITSSRDSPRAPHGQPSRNPVRAHCQVGNRPVNRRSESMGSTQSRASDRLSILTTSHDQPSRLPRVTHRQFGRGPDPSRSRERPTRPNTPRDPRPSPGITTMNLASLDHEDSSVSLVLQPSASSPYNPSTESPPISSSATNPIIEEPLAIETATAHSPPGLTVVDQHEELVPGSPTSFGATSDYGLPEGRFVQLFNSEQVPRYDKDALIPPVGTVYDVKPLTTTFPYISESSGFEQDPMFQQDCSPWIPATHPDGALYFYDQERRLFTDTDMHNTILREEIEHFYDFLQRLLQIDDLSIPSHNYDLVLDIMAIDNQRISWSYYYACHQTRCLFWLETYDASYMISELFGVKSPAHVKHRLESLYWKHWSLFPVVFLDHRLPLDVYDELMGTLMYGCVDVMTSRSSTLPYDDDTMRRMMPFVQAAKEATSNLAYYNVGMTRLLSLFAHWRFRYFHGQRHARVLQDRSLYSKPRRERSLLITLLSPLLFLAPDAYLWEMEKTWMDGIIREPDWKRFISKLLAQWESVILWSTVMLAANVGFLAIPGVVLSNINGSNLTSASQVTIFTSPTQIASCLSVQASIGSIVIGMPLLRRHMTKIRNDPEGARQYLYRNSRSAFGLEPMAIVFSLPWALLMWSMATFFLALLLFCFTISNKATRISVIAMSIMVVILIVWSVGVLEYKLAREVWQNNLAVFRRTGGNIFTCVKNFGTFRARHVPRHVPQDHFALSDLVGRV